MVESFKLHLPLADPYRQLVPEVASRYAELAGGTPADGAAVADALRVAVDRLSASAGPDASVDLSFRPDSTGVHVDVVCNGHHEALRVKLPVSKS